MKKIGILGSTGSIGTQSLEVIDTLSEQFQLVYLTANNNVIELRGSNLDQLFWNNVNISDCLSSDSINNTAIKMNNGKINGVRRVDKINDFF